MYEELVSLFLKRTRGDVDCMTMSKKMGYSYNQYFKLENGYKKLTYDDFVKICNLQKDYDLKDIFNKELNIRPDSSNQEDIITSYCDEYGDPSKVLIEDVKKLSTAKWGRLSNNKTKLFFSDFLNLIDNTGNDVFSFLSHFLGGINIIDKKFNPKFKEEQNKFLEINPDAAFLMVALMEKRYIESENRHLVDVLQKVSGLERERFISIFQDLMKLGVIYFDKDEKRYARSEYKTDSRTHRSYDLSKNLFIHGLNKQIDYLKSEKDNSKISFGVKVMTVTPQGYQEIKEELRKTYEKISHIIENETGEENREMAFFQFGVMLLSDSSSLD
jgi:hypothetical protein